MKRQIQLKPVPSQTLPESGIFRVVAETLPVILFLALGALVNAQDCIRWVQRTDVGSPGIRWSHAMAYDSDRGITVLFGGALGGLLTYQDTWEFDGNTWKEIFIDGPVPDERSHAAMCYDTVRHEMVLYGGMKGSGEKFNETWVYRSNGPGHGIWTQKSGLPVRFTPDETARAGHAMVFDARRGVAVMVGGTDSEETGTGAPPDHRVSEVWEWNGQNWSSFGQLFSGLRYEGPTLHAMVYDSDTGTLSMSGGGYYYFVRPVFDDWKDLDWGSMNAITPGTSSYRTEYSSGPIGGTSVGRRQDHAAAYDSDRRRIVVFGGVALHDSPDGDPGNRHDEAVFLPGDYPRYSASRFAIVTPPARQGHRMVYDTRRQRMVMFGGIRTGAAGTLYSDTWEYGLGSVPIYYVDAANSAAQEGSLARPFRTVRQGASAAGDCPAVLRIRSGDYPEGALTLEKPMRLETRDGLVQIH